MRFTKDHEWVDLEGDVATIGITAYAADQLGDIVFVEAPHAGQALKAGGPMAMIESVKVASDIYAPVDGEVLEVNADLPNAPEMVNEAPESRGWIAKVKVSDLAQVEAMMDRLAYEAFLDTL